MSNFRCLSNLQSHRLHLVGKELDPFPGKVFFQGPHRPEDGIPFLRGFGIDDHEGVAFGPDRVSPAHPLAAPAENPRQEGVVDTRTGFVEHLQKVRLDGLVCDDFKTCHAFTSGDTSCIPPASIAPRRLRLFSSRRSWRRLKTEYITGVT